MNIKNIFDCEIYIINLKRRNDRLQRIKENLLKINLNEIDYNVIEAVDNKNLNDKTKIKIGALACNKSYLKTFEIFLNTNKNYCLIFEDDCDFTQEFNYQIFNEIKECNLLYFGGNKNHKVMQTFSKNFDIANNVYSSHCILYSRKTIEYLVNYMTYNIISNFEYDVILANKIQSNNCYITKNLYTFQYRDFSDVENKNVDYSTVIR